MKKLIVFLLLLSTLVMSSACTVTPTPGSLEWRLDRLVEQLEQQRQALHVPGMAIAVVKDDEVVLDPRQSSPLVHLPKPLLPLLLACLLTKGRWTGTMR